MGYKSSLLPCFFCSILGFGTFAAMAVNVSGMKLLIWVTRQPFLLKPFKFWVLTGLIRRINCIFKCFQLNYVFAEWKHFTHNWLKLYNIINNIHYFKIVFNCTAIWTSGQWFRCYFRMIQWFKLDWFTIEPAHKSHMLYVNLTTLVTCCVCICMQ